MTLLARGQSGSVQQGWLGRRARSGVAAAALALTLLWVGAAVAQDGAKPSGELRMVMAGIGNLRPAPWQESVFSKGYMTLVYDFLVGANADGTLSAANGAAQSWEMSPDGKTWTFRLRQGITFHDGSELTAADAKWSLEMMLRPDSASGFAARLRSLIGEIEAPDTHTLVIRTKSPAIFLANDLSLATSYDGAILPKNYYEKVGQDGFAAKPVGSGPYKWVKAVTGSSLELEAVDKHWAEGVPKFKTVTYRVVPEESTRIAMLRTGEADVAGISRERVAELQRDGFKIFVKERGSVMGCYFHQQWEEVPVADKRVRQAMNMALNRQEITEFIFAKQAKPVAMYPIGSYAVAAGGDPSLQPYPYDPEKAKKLLAEAGYPNGFETTIYSYTREDVPELGRLIETIAGYLAEIGVKLNIFATEYPVARTRRMTGKMPGHMSCLGTPNRAGAGDLLSILYALHHSKSKFTDHHSAELDALLDRASTTIDPAEVPKLLGDIHRWLYNDFATLPIAEVSIPFVVNGKKVTDWNLGRTLYDNNDRDLIRRR
jgi:peptide/nickel transport system substrate-binding protein